MKIIYISTLILTMSFANIKAQTKAVVPKDLKPSTSMVSEMKDGAFVISEKQDLYDNGQMKSSGMHTMQNKKTGKWYYFREDGTVDKITFYNEGLYNGKIELFDENNNLTEDGYFEMDVAVKTWNTYHANGKVKMTGNYINGNREGKWPIYNDSGTLVTEVNFTLGEKNGIEKMYFDNKKLETEVSWTNGKLDGPFKQYYANGNVKMQGAHTKGEKSGHWTRYLEDGTLEDEFDF